MLLWMEVFYCTPPNAAAAARVERATDRTVEKATQLNAYITIIVAQHLTFATDQIQ
jgi:hypothetical protein